MLGKPETAMVLTPFDIAATLAIYGAEQAFLWTGARPRNESEFYLELGRKMSSMTIMAFIEQLKSEERNEWE